MATKPTRVEVNCETGEQSVIELTNAEIAQMEADAAAFAEQKAAADAAAEAAAEAKTSGLAKLMALGLTEAEANALVK
jgi:hypothetical protein